MIPAECRDDIVQSGISFIRSICEAYGAEQGMQLWTTIADTLDPDIKGQIFMAMLTNSYNDVVKISSHNIGADRVRMIKTVRSVDRRGLGLKEAKDMCDALSSGQGMRLEIDSTIRASVLSELRRAGFHV